MRLASLFSGGKDSTFAIRAAQDLGHDVACLLSLFAKSDESHLLHHPNMQWTALQSESIGIPQLTGIADSIDTQSELSVLESLLARAKDEFGIQGLLHGGIRSKFQSDAFGRACLGLGLAVSAPLWNMPAAQYMATLLESGFKFVMTSVCADGLDESWLGRPVTAPDLERLMDLSIRHGFNLDFEGGEAETFVVDCPLFSHPVEIVDSVKVWDGYRGRLEIVDAALKS